MSFILGSMAMQCVLKRHGRDRGAPVRKHVLIAFCDEADDLGRIPARYEGKLANEHLARRSESDPRTVVRAKGELVNDGWLLPVGHTRRGRGKATLYRVNVEKLRSALRAVQAEARAVEEIELGDMPGGVAVLGGDAPVCESETINDLAHGDDIETYDDFQESETNKTHLTPEPVNGGVENPAKMPENEGQDHDCKDETGKVGQISTASGKVGQISPESWTNKTPNPINPPPPYSPPPPGSASGGAAAPDAAGGCKGDPRSEPGAGRPPGTFAGTSQPGSAAQGKTDPVNWVGVRNALIAAIGREPALNLISGAVVENGTLIFTNRFKFADARDRHAQLLAGTGVRVIAMDTPGSESVRLIPAKGN